MNSIKVEKHKLIEVMQKNRAEHRDSFLEAQNKFREVVIKTLDEELKAARDGRPFVKARITSLVEPRDHTDEYDRVIGMLQMDINNEVELTQMEYMQYVDDEWGWMHKFANEVSSYGVSSAKLNKYTRQD